MKDDERIRSSFFFCLSLAVFLMALLYVVSFAVVGSMLWWVTVAAGHFAYSVARKNLLMLWHLAVGVDSIDHRDP